MINYCYYYIYYLLSVKWLNCFNCFICPFTFKPLIPCSIYVSIICLILAMLLYWQRSHFFHTCSDLSAHSVVSFHCVLPKLVNLVIIFYSFIDFLPIHCYNYCYYFYLLYVPYVYINQSWCPLAFNELLIC